MTHFQHSPFVSLLLALMVVTTTRDTCIWYTSASSDSAASAILLRLLSGSLRNCLGALEPRRDVSPACLSLSALMAVGSFCLP
jgi:hypothetical protein